MKRFIILVLAVFFPAAAHAAADDYLFFPDGRTVPADRPIFFWQISSDNAPALFRVTIDNGNGMIPFFEGTPQRHKDFLYLASPKPLAAGDYSYELFPLYDGKQNPTKYFGWRKYPLKGRFTASDSAPPADPVREIEFLSATDDNISGNGINSLFFGGGALVCGGIAALFFTVLDYSVWTKAVAYTFAAGAVTGAGASVFYGCRYISTRNDIERAHRAPAERGIHLSFSSQL